MAPGDGPRASRAPFRLRISAIAGALLGLAFTAAGQDGGGVPPVEPREFSARVVWRTEGRTRDALLFVKPDRYRLEHRGGIKTELGYASVTIVRQDLGELWYVFSKRRIYVAVPLRPAHLLPFEARLEGEISRRLVGPAAVGERPARLYDIVVRRYGRREGFYQWLDRETGMVLKLVSKHRDWSVEYEHVVLSTQPSYYFEVPRGYRRVEAQEHITTPE